MKTPKPTITLALLFVAVIGLVLQNQRVVSQSNPPTPSFRQHYSEIPSFTLAPGESSAPIPLPVLDRPVRFVISAKFPDFGNLVLADLPCAYNTSDGSFQILFQNGGPYFGGLDYGYFFNISGGTNGTVTIKNISPDLGNETFSIALWY